MAKGKNDWYARLSRIFKGPAIKRRIRDYRTPPTSTALELFNKTQSFVYSNALNAYGSYDRLARAADYSEMDQTPEIASALDILADETVSQDERGKVLHVFSDNRKIRGILEELFYDTLNVDFNLRMWVRNILKFGDFFVFNDIAPGHGILQVFPIPVNEVEREEGFDPEDPLAVRFRWVTQGNVALENWQVTHFRMLGNDAFLPYGSSLIEPARRIWRQLILLEDAMLVYRVVRSPERRIFYIDVGGIPPEEVPAYMEAQERKLRSSTIVDRDTGRVDFRHNPLETLEDYFIPVRGAESGTKIDTLSGGQHVSATEDVEYIQRKLIAALKIPRAYLGYEDAISSKATLSAEDIRFSRTIQQIQKVVIAELQNLAYIHLFMNGYEGEDMFDFQLKLNNPSSIAQQQKLELFARKVEIVGNALGVDEGKVFSVPYLLRNVMDMTEQQQNVMHDEVIEDVQRRAALTKVGDGATPESVGFEGGGGFTPSGGLGDAAADIDDELEGGDNFADDVSGDETGDDATPETPGEADDDEGPEDLFQGVAREGDILGEDDEPKREKKQTSLVGDLSHVDDHPVKFSMSARMKQKQWNRKRSQTRHGPLETGFVDFERALAMDDQQDEPFNVPDGLDVELKFEGIGGNDSNVVRPRVTGALRSIFDSLEREFGDELAELRATMGLNHVLLEGGAGNSRALDELIEDDDFVDSGVDPSTESPATLSDINDDD